jgi:hypothetical protein
MVAICCNLPAAARRTTMAKGQQRSNKEAKKPKKQKQPAPVAAGFIKKPRPPNEPFKPNS